MDIAASEAQWIVQISNKDLAKIVLRVLRKWGPEEVSAYEVIAEGATQGTFPIFYNPGNGVSPLTEEQLFDVRDLVSVLMETFKMGRMQGYNEGWDAGMESGGAK